MHGPSKRSVSGTRRLGRVDQRVLDRLVREDVPGNVSDDYNRSLQRSLGWVLIVQTGYRIQIGTFSALDREVSWISSFFGRGS